MKTTILIVLAITTITASTQATEKIIYDYKTKNTIADFILYGETPAEVITRPGIQTSEDGIISKPGDGNFTAYKFIDLETTKWTLRVVFQIANDVRYSNSGIYLVYQDPKISLQDLPGDQQPFFVEAFAKAQERRKRYGPGPFELDFLSHELQIIAGTDSTIPLENHGAAAFYDVSEGSIDGTQQILNPQFLENGETYEMTLENDGLVKKSYIRNIKNDENTLVAKFTNLPTSLDPVRGGSPKAIVLQGFYSNGRDVKLPIFKRISIDLN